MASVMKRIGSSSGNLQLTACKEELAGRKSGHGGNSDTEATPSKASIQYVMVGYPEVHMLQGLPSSVILVNGAADQEQKDCAAKDDAASDDSEDDFAGVAAELRKVEAHSKLSTAVQKGFSGNVQNSVRKLGDTLAKVQRSQDAGTIASDDDDSMFTAARSLRKKLSSSKIHVDSSEPGETSEQGMNDISSEYSASHDVDSVYVSPHSSKFTSSPGSLGNFSQTAGGSPDSSQSESRVGEPSTWQSVDPSQGNSDVSGWPANEPAPLDIPVDSFAPVAAVQAQQPPSNLQTGMRTLPQQDVHLTRRSSTGESVPVSYMEGADWDVHTDGGTSFSTARPSCEEHQWLASGSQAKRLVLREWENLTPDQQLLLKVEELELKVNFLLAERQSQRLPDGFVVLALPTLHQLRNLAMQSAHQMKSRLVQRMYYFWPLRPFVPVINTMEDIACAIINRLPLVGLTEKQRM